MEMKKNSTSTFIKTALTVVYIALFILVLLSLVHNIYVTVFPDNFWIELKLSDNKMEEPDIRITFENWRQVPKYVQIFVLLRKNLPGLIYLVLGLIIVAVLKKLYNEVMVVKDYNIVNARHIKKIGMAILFYTIIDFIVKLLLNISITYNHYTQTSSNIHVGTRIAPPFALELFIFGLVILVLADIYLRITEIQDDLKLTI